MKTFSQILKLSYLEVPDKAAVHLLYSRQSDQTLTYRHLVNLSAGYAHVLGKAGIRPGEVVILILDHGQDLLTAFFGGVLHGVIPSIMPFLTEKLLPDQYRDALQALFEITKPAAVITYDDFVDDVRQACVGSAVRSIIVAEQIREQISPERPIQWENLNGLQRELDDVVLLQHSSGTTGLQKGVALSHKAVFNQIESYARALHIESDDVVVSWLPLYHDMGLIAGFIMPILKRVPLVLISPFDWVRAPYRLMQAITQYHGTLCWLPNFAYNFCAQKIRPRDLEGVDLATLRALVNCSEPVYLDSHTMFLERFQPYGLRSEALTTCYAMAENVFAVTQGGIDFPVTVDVIDRHSFSSDQIARPVEGNAEGEKSLKMLSAGRPIDNTRVRVIGSQGRDLPEREIGEIVLLSDCMLTEYYHRPDLTEKTFQDGWYLTGDLGYMADGELYITGRIKDLIIVGGKNIYPQDLERLASEVNGVHPGRVVAIGVFNDRTGTEDVVVIAEADYEDRAERERIASEIRKTITRGSDVALRFAHVVGRNWLVKTSSGKIARRANRTKYLAETLQSS